MYYKGTPFVENNELNKYEVSKLPSYFIEVCINQSFCKKIYKNFTNSGQLILVIYSCIGNDNDNEIYEYHRTYFSKVPFDIQNTVSDRVINVKHIRNYNLNSSLTTIYDDFWRPKFEYLYDNNFLLIECREFYYSTDLNETPFKENVFFRESWSILTENYDT